MRRLVDFLALDAGPGAIEEAIAAASFAAMRQLEQREIGARQPGLFGRGSYRAGHARGHRLVNRGAVRCGGELLSADERRRVGRAFAAEIALLGYADLAAELD